MTAELNTQGFDWQDLFDDLAEPGGRAAGWGDDAKDGPRPASGRILPILGQKARPTSRPTPRWSRRWRGCGNPRIGGDTPAPPGPRRRPERPIRGMRSAHRMASGRAIPMIAAPDEAQQAERLAPYLEALNATDGILASAHRPARSIW